MVSDNSIKMDYWNLTSKARGQRSLTLGTQHRVFSTGIRKYDESKGREIKSSEIESSEEKSNSSDIKKDRAGDTGSKNEEIKEENKEGGESTSTETRVSTESNGNGSSSGEEKSSDSFKRKRDHTEQEENKQESSESIRDEQSSGENGE